MAYMKLRNKLTFKLNLCHLNPIKLIFIEKLKSLI